MEVYSFFPASLHIFYWIKVGDEQQFSKLSQVTAYTVDIDLGLEVEKDIFQYSNSLHKKNHKKKTKVKDC